MIPSKSHNLTRRQVMQLTGGVVLTLSAGSLAACAGPSNPSLVEGDDTDAPMQVTVTLPITNNFHDLNAKLSPALTEIRTAPGSLKLSAFTSADRDLVFLIQEWRSRKAFQTYLERERQFGLLVDSLSDSVSSGTSQTYRRLAI